MAAWKIFSFSSSAPISALSIIRPTRHCGEVEQRLPRNCLARLGKWFMKMPVSTSDQNSCPSAQIPKSLKSPKALTSTRSFLKDLPVVGPHKSAENPDWLLDGKGRLVSPSLKLTFKRWRNFLNKVMGKISANQKRNSQTRLALVPLRL